MAILLKAYTAIIKSFFAVVLVWMCSNTVTAQSPPFLERPVTLSVSNQTYFDVFKTISSQTGVVFSYNPQQFNDKQTVTISVKNKPLRWVMTELLKNLPCTYTLKKKYIIIRCEAQKTPAKKSTYIISGYLVNAADSSKIINASVFIKTTRESALSDSFGFFQLTASKSVNPLHLSFAKEEFLDTTLQITETADTELWVYLSPEIKKIKTVATPLLQDTISTEIDSIPQQIAGDSNVTEKPTNKFWERQKKLNANIRNIRDTLFSKVSISLVPSISTNKLLSFNTVNKFSFNILIGKSREVNGFELGGLINYDYGNVKYAQVAGLANVVGGDAKYVQTAGLFNSVLGNVEGAQFGGLYNTVGLHTRGVQFGGLFNHSRTVYGTQFGGIYNAVTDTIYGAQFGGIFNYAKNGINGAQFGGVFNQSKMVKGLQVAGVYNATTDTVLGAQIAGVFNAANYITGVQIAGAINVANKLQGTQIAGLLNYAKVMKGVQIAPFNFADSCTGLPIGVFTYIKTGYHKIEVAFDELQITTLGFRSGVDALHNVFFAGINNFNDQKLWTYGYGLGSYLKFTTKKGLLFDASAQQLQNINTTKIKLNLLNRFSISYTYLFAKKFNVAIGPSINFLIQDNTDIAFSKAFNPIAPHFFADATAGNTQLRAWLGAKVSLKFL
jgi:hypothetical protein